MHPCKGFFKHPHFFFLAKGAAAKQAGLHLKEWSSRSQQTDLFIPWPEDVNAAFKRHEDLKVHFLLLT